MITQTTPEVERYVAAFDDLEKELGNGAEWFAGRRRQAIERLSELGFPTPRVEEWRFTPTGPITRTPFRPAQADDIDQPEGDELGRLLGVAAGPRLVFLNGRFAAALSRLDVVPAGVEVVALAQAIRQQPTPPWLTRHLATLTAEHHAFNALNTAFAADGACLVIADGTVVTEPIELAFLAVPARDGSPLASHPRNLIVAGANSQITVIETHQALTDHVYLQNPVTEVFAGANASVEHVKLQVESRSGFHVASFDARLDRDSRVTQRSFSLGAALARFDVNMVQAAPGVECTLDGLFVTGDGQHVDHHTSVDHAQPHGSSHELYKGVLDGRSTGVFNGKVTVRPDAQKTDSRQTNKNLLLSRDAIIETKPELEIYADDVKCGHGATIGQLDETALFYLRSRGLPLEQARNTLIYAFAAEMVERVAPGPLRNRLSGLLLERMPGISPEIARSIEEADPSREEAEPSLEEADR